VAAASTFLCQLVSSRTKVTFLPILHFVNGIFDSHPTASQRFGALSMLSALAPFAMRHPDVKGKMEDFTMKYVFPEFAAPEGYMRAAVRHFSRQHPAFRRLRSPQANEVVAALVRNRIIWTSDEVRHRIPCRWGAAL
jgi:hypothetical protein